MITRSKLPFFLTFETKKEGIISARRFTIDPDRLTGHFPAALALTENQDIFLRFEAPPGFRFTMDGLDIVTLPGQERESEQTYILPEGKKDILLFSGQDFPLVPGYYVMTVEGAGRAWYGILEINPRYMEKQSWQEMRDELVEEIKTLSFDFMKRNIHISRQLEGALGVNTEMLLRFYTIRDESPVVLNVLDELARTANSRLALRMKHVRTQADRRTEPHIRPQHFHDRAGAPTTPALYTEMTWDVAENRFAKALLMKLDQNLFTFIKEIDGHVERLEDRQREIARFSRDREYRMGVKALSQFIDYRKRATLLRQSIRRVTLAPWYEETKGEMPETMPMAVFRDPRYSVLYRLYKNLENPFSSLDVSSFYQFQWKRTDKLYEMWGFLRFIKALMAKGWELEDGVEVLKEEGKYRLASLESGTEIRLKRENAEIRLVYDGIVPGNSADTSRDKAPLYTNNSHRQPDLRMDYYKEGLYYGSLVADFKYRDVLFLWQDENRSYSIRKQFNAYRDMNTRFYRDMTEAASLRDSRPVKEVWAVFPKEIPGRSDADYSLRFIPLAPGLPGNEELPDLLEKYIESI
uniref:DUF2357 domain-containing protein n=1 Tax=Dialister hominis TaxID=2582419 RepID=UPI00402872C4